MTAKRNNRPIVKCDGYSSVLKNEGVVLEPVLIVPEFDFGQDHCLP